MRRLPPRRRGVDGIVYRRIDHAEIREVSGILYCNTSDWIESRTSVVEHFHGRLVDWINRWAPNLLIGRAAAPAESEVEAPALLEPDS